MGAREAWAEFVFDRIVSTPNWYQGADAEEWSEEPAQVAGHIVSTFENAGEFLSGWSDAQLDQGFWYMAYGDPGGMSALAPDEEIRRVLRRLLEIPHDACRESALHGVLHWAESDPVWARETVDELAGTARLRPELVAYAELATRGIVTRPIS
jgi:hypothetical protein